MNLDSEIKILFYGTPEFAAYSLREIHKKDFNVIGVVTAPDRASGRGLKVHKSAVKITAEELGLEILQPSNLKSEDFQKDLQRLKPDVQIVIAFRMLPESVWSFPQKGTFNLHASLLPQYRGAAPINWAIINGEKETGVTTFFIEKEIDTGKIILQNKVEISENENAGTLHDKLMVRGAEIVLETLNQIQNGTVKSKKQNISNLTLKPAPKIFSQGCYIDFNQKAENVINFIRGMSPYPAARAEFNGKLYKIFDAKISDDSNYPKLDISEWNYDKESLLIGCQDGNISVKSIQQEGKKIMEVNDFLKGWRG